MITHYAFCAVSLTAMRKSPSHEAEQVSQLLYGDRVEIIERGSSNWVRIRAEWDSYEGWCLSGTLEAVSKRIFHRDNKFISVGKGVMITATGAFWLPEGSELIKIKSTSPSDKRKFKGKKKAVDETHFRRDHLRAVALGFLNVPYLWGGKTVAGIDCSGLTQMIYKLCGRRIPRDASQQALQGEEVGFLQHAQCGDLAFFDNEAGRITHVGMLLDAETIIHATETSGKVVVDRIDAAGIISQSLKRRTHQLRIIKTFF